MRNLIVVGFHNQYRAAEVLNELRRLNDDWVVELDDAVAVYRDHGGNLRYQQSVAFTVGEGAALGELWGSLLGALLFVPIAAGAAQPSAPRPWPWPPARSRAVRRRDGRSPGRHLVEG